MKILNVAQGSPEWLAARAQYRAASEAPAMMNASSKLSRAELVRMKALGLEKEFSGWVQKHLLDKGHEVEALARPIVEHMIGEELYPVTATDDAGYLLASLDGLTMDEAVIFEHKAWNEELAESVRNNIVPDENAWQLDQQQLVTGAKRTVFVVSDGTREKMVFCWYRSTDERQAALIAGWKQFDKDVAEYQHVEVLPPPVAAPIRDLPALSVEIAGSVVASNLAEWRGIVTERIAAINTDLQTDQDFADADKMVKFLDEGEKRIELVKQQAQAQATSIDEVFRALDEIKATMRAKRLELDKLVAARKESIRAEIRDEGFRALSDHIAALNKRLKIVPMPAIAADFGGAMKGKKNVTSLRDAVAGLLAQKKIEADAIADKIAANLVRYGEIAAGYEFLFRDLSALALKDCEAFDALVQQRISQHVEAKRKEEEAQREKIRREEEAKAQAKVRAEQDAEAKRIADAQKKLDDEASAKTVAPIIAAEIAARKEDTLPIALREAFAPSRPRDDDIIRALSQHYRVHESKVIEWLLDMDLNAASDRMMREFAA